MYDCAESCSISVGRGMVQVADVDDWVSHCGQMTQCRCVTGDQSRECKLDTCSGHGPVWTGRDGEDPLCLWPVNTR